jgi:chromosome segregation ATPase
MEKKLLPYLVVFSALSVSLSAAFYSVTGIGKMFAGSQINVMIMMTSLEIAKLVLSSILYQFWNKFNTILKVYYFSAIFVLMAITSGGIYGYLSAAYSETAVKLENIDRNVELIESKKDIIYQQLETIKGDKDRVNDNIIELTKALSNNNEQYIDRKTGQVLTRSSTANRKAYQEQLTLSQKEKDDLLSKESVLNDSISSLSLLKLELENNTEVAAELGPLRYISKITGKSIDNVVNWFIIALMLVFDPLAVSLVVGANVIFSDRQREKDVQNKLKNIEKTLEEKKTELDGLDDEISNRRSELDRREVEITQRESNLDKEKIKIDELLSEKQRELDSIFSKKSKNLEEDYKEKFEYIRKKESEITELKSQLESEKSLIIDEKKVISNLRKEIDRQNRVLHEDKEEYNLEMTKLKELKRELEKKEFQIEVAMETLNRLDNEIKEWESTHWKLRKNPPGV